VRNQNGSILRTPSIGGGSFGLPANSSKQKKGWAFVKYFTDKQFSESSARQGAVVPRDSSYLNPDVRDKIPEFDVYRRSLEISKFRPRVAHFPEVETIVGAAISQAILSPKENTLAILEEAAKKTLALTRRS
jgi:ABC-type glycerol-3-phosphate transport system substrate-binding protein